VEQNKRGMNSREIGAEMAGAKIRFLIGAALAATVLTGCVEGSNPFARNDKPAGEAGAVRAATSVTLVDRDVEAPEVFAVTDQALWDGRPSLGGVWVASPDTTDPERVILRNTANGKFVIGALFRRERENPGPKLQISSDAAAALEVLAGQPVEITVTALRREEAPTPTPDASRPILDAAETVEVQSLDAPAVAAAALDRVEAAPAPAPTPLPAVTPVTGGGLIQIGIFSVEANAKRAVDTLTKGGVTADLRREESQGKAYWSVTARGDAPALTKIKGLGFADAYFLKR